MNALLAVDDGIWSGNLNLADVFFLIAVILAVISALAAWVPIPTTPPTYGRFAGPLLSLAVGFAALGLMVL